MLVLSRMQNEYIVIDHHIRVGVVDIRGNKVRLGIEAPAEVAVHREEIEKRTWGPGISNRARSAPVERVFGPNEIYTVETDDERVEFDRLEQARQHCDRLESQGETFKFFVTKTRAA